ncbi:cytochrome d ubiquinol oxidase subunit II [Rhodococcus sp. X156]|uniref:cytochrome d ubiquinol oxidase subunit II n=1 Tax=Rhodococcus sp. X156 TaxID=2499145 RepID=UPI000FD8515B|nr:cytochrome d ubiquinol oxidase subunit II [Rhodococcus sp. X156]
MDLETVWFIAIVVLWMGFLLLEGFDFGVAMLVPVLARGDAERTLMLRTIGPVWDGNEVWLITAAGAIFAAFPGWYASWLPAMYLPFVVVLLALIARAVGFEWRHSHDTEAWNQGWTRTVTVSSTVACLGIGAALAVTTLGLPIAEDGTRTGGAFSGLGWTALLGAVAVLAFSVVHGAIFLALKTDGPVRARAWRLTKTWLPVGALPLLVWVGLAQARFGNAATATAAVVAVLAAVLAWWLVRADREGWAFTVWSLFMLLCVGTIFGAQYPVVVPSTLTEAFDLTIYDTSVSHYTLVFITWVAAFVLPFVLVYEAWSYWVFRRRLTADDQGPHSVPA